MKPAPRLGRAAWRSLAVAALMATPLPSAPARGESLSYLLVEAAEAEPARRFRVTIDAPHEVTEVRLEVEGRASERLARRPFTTTVRFADGWRPRWILAVGLDARGREAVWLGRRPRTPDDQVAARLHPVPDGGVAVLVEPAKGRRIRSVDLIAPGATGASRARPPYVFSGDEVAALAPESAAPLGARIRFDAGADLEVWRAAEIEGEVVDVRLGQARLLLPADAARPAPQSVRARWRGREQRILRVVGGAEESLELGLLIDVSGSTAPDFAAFRRAAARSALTVSGRSDRLFVAEFGDRARMLASGRARAGEILAHLPTAPRPEKTALSPAISWALGQFHGEYARAALLVVSDGCDTTERTSIGRFAPIARERGIPVFLLRRDRDCQAGTGVHAQPGSPATVTAQRIRSDVERAVRATGGEVLVFATDEELERRLDELLLALGRQWLVVFEPQSDAVDSRDVKVELLPR